MTPLLTAREVAKLLGVHPNTIKHMVRRKEIAHYRLGTRGDLRFRVEDVEAWLEGRRA